MEINQESRRGHFFTVVYFFVDKYVNLVIYILLVAAGIILQVYFSYLKIRGIKFFNWDYDEEKKYLHLHIVYLKVVDSYIPIHHIKQVAIKQNFLQKKYGLATVEIFMGNSSITIEDIDTDKAFVIKDDISLIILKEQK